MSRRLIVNADDFGFTRDVNAGIVEAFQHGILRATTLMANGSAFDDAARLAGENPGLQVGVHFVLVGGEPLTKPGTVFPDSVPGLLAALGNSWKPAAIRDEARAQIEKIAAAGLEPRHIDAHKHTHLIPQVLDALLDIAPEYGIRWVRRPFDLPLTAAAGAADWKRRVVSRALATARNGFETKISAVGMRSTDHFAGFQLTGSLREAELVRLIETLPEGVTELMTHPGRCTQELRGAPTRLKESREAELAALCSDKVEAAAEASAVEVSGFSDL